MVKVNVVSFHLDLQWVQLFVFTRPPRAGSISGVVEGTVHLALNELTVIREEVRVIEVELQGSARSGIGGVIVYMWSSISN
jgi:hypothetical protein